VSYNFIGASGGILIAWRANLVAAGATRTDSFSSSVQIGVS
jgi:hypothetical protein